MKVEAFWVNPGETFKLEAPVPGWRPGKDVAGLVVQPAADGSGPTGIARVIGHPMAGGWAEFAAVPTDALAVLPDTVTAIQGAALPAPDSPRCGCCAQPSPWWDSACC